MDPCSIPPYPMRRKLERELYVDYSVNLEWLFCKYQTLPFYEDKSLAFYESYIVSFTFVYSSLDSLLAENVEVDESSLALVQATEKALILKSQDTDAVLYKGSAKSGSEYFAARSFQGLNPDYENPLPQSYVVGRKGRAAGYKDEAEKPESDSVI